MKGYLLIGFSTVLIASLFAFFLDESNIEYDHLGIVHDVKASSSGYTFYIDCSDTSFRCFCKERPDDLGYYGISGTFSNDRTMFFVEHMGLVIPRSG